MLYKLLADGMVLLHFIWIAFMIVGFLINLAGLFRREILNWWIFRTVHLIGILYVSLLAAMGKYCPLTVWESNLRMKHDPSLVYPGHFIVHYFEKWVYPNVPAVLVLIPTFVIGAVSLSLFLIFPPNRIKSLFRRSHERAKCGL